MISDDLVALGGSVGVSDISITGVDNDYVSIIYAHYQGEKKSCEGWNWGCDGNGRTRITNWTPIHPCPDRNK